MFDFAYAYCKYTALICRLERDMMRHAAQVEHPLPSQAVSCFKGQLHGSVPTVILLTYLAKTGAYRVVVQRAILRDLVDTVGTGRTSGVAFSSGNGSLGNSLPALPKQDYQPSRSLSSVPSRATIRTIATPTA